MNGQNQSLSVDTTPVSDAKCTLSNDKGTWYVNGTPGSVTVGRSYDPLNVDCEKGAYNGIMSIESKTKGMAFGNLLFGGIIGAGVDMSNGSAYDYPTPITVPMKKGK